MNYTLKATLALLLGCYLLSPTARAQDRKLVLDGNALYDQQKFKEAAEQYRKALDKTPASVPAAFNLGNALLQQKRYDEARKVMQDAAKISKDKGVQSGANYNTGNANMQERKWGDAVTNYKQALRANPADADAKYNLSYALSKLKQEQQQKQQQSESDKKQQPQSQQPQQRKPDPQKQEDQPQPQQNQLSQQQADNLLNALEDEERKLRDKQQRENGVPAHQAKDW